jgi:hypothetical protein
MDKMNYAVSIGIIIAIMIILAMVIAYFFMPPKTIFKIKCITGENTNINTDYIKTSDGYMSKNYDILIKRSGSVFDICKYDKETSTAKCDDQDKLGIIYPDNKGNPSAGKSVLIDIGPCEKLGTLFYGSKDDGVVCS